MLVCVCVCVCVYVCLYIFLYVAKDLLYNSCIAAPSRAIVFTRVSITHLLHRPNQQCKRGNAAGSLLGSSFPLLLFLPLSPALSLSLCPQPLFAYFMSTYTYGMPSFFPLGVREYVGRFLLGICWTASSRVVFGRSYLLQRLTAEGRRSALTMACGFVTRVDLEGVGRAGCLICISLRPGTAYGTGEQPLTARTRQAVWELLCRVQMCSFFISGRK